MTSEEKNIAIAEMMKAFSVEEWEGLHSEKLPYYKGKCFNPNRDPKSWNCGSSNKEEVRTMLGKTLHFDTDVNWQFEALEFVEKLGYSISITSHARARMQGCSIYDTEGKILALREGNSITKKEAIFEALYNLASTIKHLDYERNKTRI